MYSRWLNYFRFLYKGELFVPLPKEDIVNLLTLVTRKPKDFLPYYQKERISNLYKFNGVVTDAYFSVSLDSNSPVFFIPKVKGELISDNNGTWIKLKGSLFFSTKFTFVSSIIIMLFICVFLSLSNQYTYASLLFVFYLLGYVVGILDFKSNINRTIARLKKELSFS